MKIIFVLLFTLFIVSCKDRTYNTDVSPNNPIEYATIITDDDGVFSKTCITKTSNCFCSHQNLGDSRARISIPCEFFEELKKATQTTSLKNR